MNNLLSYCGLVDARISASGKDLPVLKNSDFLKANKHFQLCLAPLETPHRGTSLY